MVIIAAVDRSVRSSRVVNEAVKLAKAFDDKIHVVHSLTRSEFLDLSITSAQAEDSKDIEQIRSAAAEMAEKAVSGVDVPYETVGLFGNPADEIVRYAEDQNARYIVVSPRKRSRTGKVLFGSVAQSILLNANCPVVSSIDQNHSG